MLCVAHLVSASHDIQLTKVERHSYNLLCRRGRRLRFDRALDAIIGRQATAVHARVQVAVTASANKNHQTTERMNN